jgi:hypothetical protein
LWEAQQAAEDSSMQYDDDNDLRCANEFRASAPKWRPEWVDEAPVKKRLPEFVDENVVGEVYFTDPIEVLREIARGRTEPWDTCTPETAREALELIDAGWWQASDNDNVARNVLGWTEREL